MNPDALLELVRQAVRAEVAPLRRMVERLAPPPLSPLQRELFDALGLVLGGSPFTSGEVVELSRRPVGQRPRLAAALEALGIKDAHDLGMLLAQLVKRTQTLDVRLVRAGKESNSGMWVIESGPSGA